jgi:hypothetical protein
MKGAAGIPCCAFLLPRRAVRAEPVETLSFYDGRTGRGFDELSPNGVRFLSA